MTAQHTPGPWRAERRQSLSVVLQMRGADDGYSNRVAECPQWSPAPHPQPTPDEAYANARLIAAAPELLEAMAVLLEIAKCWAILDGGKNIDLEASEAVQKARAALAKARGEA